MRIFSWLPAIALCLALAGCGKPIAPVTSLPPAVAAAENDAKAGAAKALGVLIAASKVARTLGQIESQAVAEGVVPAAADKTFDSIMVAYANHSDRAAEGIFKGVQSWDQVKALVDPVLVEVNRLIDFVNSLGALKTRAGEWGRVLKDIVSDALSGFKSPGPALGGAN